MRRKEGLQVALEQADKGRSFVLGSRSSPGMPSRQGSPGQEPLKGGHPKNRPPLFGSLTHEITSSDLGEVALVAATIDGDTAPLKLTNNMGV